MKTYKMGEISTLTGITTKALRIYLEKELIHPVAYSEAGYRLFDEHTVVTLQQITMLKFLGYTLSEIKSFLEYNENQEIETALLEQKKMLIQKREELNYLIECVEKTARACNANGAKIEDFTETMKFILEDQKYNLRYRKLYQYIEGENNWSKWVFDHARFQENMKIMDLGCGYGNLWRENWDRMPLRFDLNLVDKKDSGAKRLEADLSNGTLPSNPLNQIVFTWGNLEQMAFTKDHPVQKYDRIFLNHTIGFIVEPEKLLYKVKRALKKDGFFICTFGGDTAQKQVKEVLSMYSIKNVLDKELSSLAEGNQTKKEMLNRTFKTIEEEVYSITLKFNDAIEFYDYVASLCSDSQIESYQKKILAALQKHFINHQALIIKKETLLYRCKL